MGQKLKQWTMTHVTGWSRLPSLISHLSTFFFSSSKRIGGGKAGGLERTGEWHEWHEWVFGGGEFPIDNNTEKKRKGMWCVRSLLTITPGRDYFTPYISHDEIVGFCCCGEACFLSFVLFLCMSYLTTTSVMQYVSRTTDTDTRYRYRVQVPLPGEPPATHYSTSVFSQRGRISFLSSLSSCCYAVLCFAVLCFAVLTTTRFGKRARLIFWSGE